MLIEWNDTTTPYPDNKTIHQLFEEQVERTPDNVAVIYENQILTYKHLNEKANQLAHYLQSLGVGPDTLVAIAVERSLEMIIGLLGILKAGGAYVPLDPDYPEERLKFMLDDTRAKILITQRHLQKKLKALLRTYEGVVVVVDLMKNPGHEHSLSKQRIENPLTTTLPHHLAYVIYTSGSTGRPKGVENSNYSLLNRLSWTFKNYSISEEDTYLHISSLGFDISIWELLFPIIPWFEISKDEVNFLGSLPKLINKNSTKVSYDKIYISRADARDNRNLINEKEIENYLKSKGFKILLASKLNINNKIQIFSKAKIIITPLGSAIHNFLFCKKVNAKVVFIGTKKYFIKDYIQYAFLKKLNLHFIEATEIPSYTNAWQYNHSSFFLNPIILEKTLKIL
jgi:hypothetical protein